jgi:hypothetical protein
MNEEIAYWLLPAAPFRHWFAEQSKRLAQELGGPEFEPHLTVHTTSGARLDSPGAIVDAATRDVVAITLRPLAVNHSDSFTKTLFIEFAPSEPLTHLAAQLSALCARGFEYVLRPHLSLVYQHLSANARAALASTIAIPFETVEFDAIAAVICPKQTANAEDVRAWRVMHRKSLRVAR